MPGNVDEIKGFSGAEGAKTMDFLAGFGKLLQLPL
jgi:hypothetical protein